MEKTLSVMTVLFFLIIIAGCTKPPEKEIETAAQAIAEARKAEAASFAPKTFKASEETFLQAQNEIRNEKKKLLGKDYKKATGLLQEAVILARDAIKETEALKARTAEEATRADAETAVNRVYAAYKKAKKSKGKSAALSGVMDLLKQAQSAMKEGRYRDAVDMAGQADARLQTL